MFRYLCANVLDRRYRFANAMNGKFPVEPLLLPPPLGQGRACPEPVEGDGDDRAMQQGSGAKPQPGRRLRFTAYLRRYGGGLAVALRGNELAVAGHASESDATATTDRRLPQPAAGLEASEEEGFHPMRHGCLNLRRQLHRRPPGQLMAVGYPAGMQAHTLHPKPLACDGQERISVEQKRWSEVVRTGFF